MKKFILSSGVIGVFALYSIHMHFGGDDQTAPIVANVPITTVAPTPTTSAIPVSTPAPSGNTPQPTTVATPVPTPKSKYKDGTYTGSVADAFYGNLQVQAIISGGRITDVKFLQFPNDRGTSIAINQQADPLLTQEAIQAQSAQVSGVSGASASSGAFVESLTSALNQALN